MMKRRSVSIYIFIFAIMMPLLQRGAALKVRAQEVSEKTVRVGYYDGHPDFQDGFSDEKRKSGYAYEYYQGIAEINGWNYEYVYGSEREVMDKLLSGEVDIVAGIRQTAQYEGRVLFSRYDMGLEGEARYFAVSRERTDLLGELDLAMEKIAGSRPYFTITLLQKYYGRNAVQALSDEEAEWLKEKGSLSIGYVKNNLPLSDEGADGKPDGIIKDLVALISDYLGTPLEPVCYDNVSLMEEALQKGEIDAAFPIYSDLWISEQKGFLQTDAFISDRVMIVYLGDYRDDLMDKVALSNTGVGQRYYLSVHYPESETVFYDSRTLAFRAIRKGEVNCMIGCSSIVQRFLAEKEEFQDFNVAYLDSSEEFSIAVNRFEPQLVGIMNKAIYQMDNAVITNGLIRYSNVGSGNYTVTEFIRRNALSVILIFAVVFVVLLDVFISYRKKTKRFNREQAETRAALEEALEAAKTASKAKSAFLSNMSHDIRTPLNGIIGMTAIASMRIDDTEQVKDCLAKITSSGKHLMSLINEVLDMSKIEAGEISLSEENFSLCPLIDDLIALNRTQSDAKQQDLRVHIHHVVHEEVVGDRVRLQQVLTNLVNNAVKYTPDGGKIQIALSEKPSADPRKGCFEFVVEDNGIGISEEYLPHLFEAFTRENTDYAQNAQGTGLGMAIALNIARMMGGDIQVESKEGEGSRFTVTVYLGLREAQEVSCEQYKDLSVLLVDDDPFVCEEAGRIIEEMGMKAEWVLSGKEAIEKVDARHLEQNDYFAVLIDWKMPDKDGFDTVFDIRCRVGMESPAIMICAYDRSAVEEEALRVGANGFLAKPLFRSRLYHVFDQILNKKDQEKSSELEELITKEDLSGKKALLAEDNKLNAEIALTILGMTGLSVDWAQNGQEALDKVKASEPGYYDCIFMDVQMPVMGGVEATKNIRALDRPDAKSIPIFAMTANAFADDVQMVLDAGMNEHIAKPLNFNHMMEVLHRYLG